MAYTSPTYNNTNFTVSTYTPPLGDSVNFDLIQDTTPTIQTSVLFNFGGL